MAVAGGPAQTVGDAQYGADGSWSPRGLILLDGRGNDPLWAIEAGGGVRRPLITPDAAKGERGMAALPGRQREFRDAILKALDYTAALGCPRLHIMAGLKPEGVPHDTLGEMVVTLAAREAGHPVTGEDVIAFLKAKLASYKVPRKVIFVSEDDLNLTGTAKIKPAEARELAARKMAETESLAG